MIFCIELLRHVYWGMVWMTWPLEELWSYFFRINLKPNYGEDRNNTVIVDAMGGSGKTTLANKFRVYGYHIVHNDLAKYGLAWAPKTPLEYNNYLDEQFLTLPWIFDTTICDLKLQCQRERVTKQMNDADIILVLSLPLWMVLWRKLWRSYKRAIGVGEPGAATETWFNVRCMLQKSYSEYQFRQVNLMQDIVNYSDKVLIAKWPFYFEVN